jgi:hypothetical protein
MSQGGLDDFLDGESLYDSSADSSYDESHSAENNQLKHSNNSNGGMMSHHMQQQQQQQLHHHHLQNPAHMHLIQQQHHQIYQNEQEQYAHQLHSGIGSGGSSGINENPLYQQEIDPSMPAPPIVAIPATATPHMMAHENLMNMNDMNDHQLVTSPHTSGQNSNNNTPSNNKQHNLVKNANYHFK